MLAVENLYRVLSLISSLDLIFCLGKSCFTFKNISGCFSLLSINVLGLLRVSKQIQVNENLKLCNVIYLCKQNELEGKC